MALKRIQVTMRHCDQLPGEGDMHCIFLHVVVCRMMTGQLLKGEDSVALRRMAAPIRHAAQRVPQTSAEKHLVVSGPALERIDWSATHEGWAATHFENITCSVEHSYAWVCSIEPDWCSHGGLPIVGG